MIGDRIRAACAKRGVEVLCAYQEKEFNGGKALNGLGADKVTEPYQTKNAI